MENQFKFNQWEKILIWLILNQVQYLELKRNMVGIEGCGLGSSDFDIFLEIQYASCVFALALKS